MTKREFINYLADKNNFSVSYTNKILKAFLDSVEDGLFKDGFVKLPGIGQLVVKNVKEHEGHNPQTGGNIKIPSFHRIIFKASSKIKEEIN